MQRLAWSTKDRVRSGGVERNTDAPGTGGVAETGGKGQKND